MSLTPGAWLATINSLSPGWLTASLAQADAGPAGPRARVVATLPDYPDEWFSGCIESVLPAANDATRTVRVRIALVETR